MNKTKSVLRIELANDISLKDVEDIFKEVEGLVKSEEYRCLIRSIGIEFEKRMGE